jgi:GAF domain-containing protein
MKVFTGVAQRIASSTNAGTSERLLRTRSSKPGWLASAHIAAAVFFDSPLVTGPPHVRVYLGAPLFTPERLALGSFCVIDHKPRSWTPREASMVTELANVAAALIQSRSMRNELAELFQACASLCSPRAAA